MSERKLVEAVERRLLGIEDITFYEPLHVLCGDLVVITRGSRTDELTTTITGTVVGARVSVYDDTIQELLYRD